MKAVREVGTGARVIIKFLPEPVRSGAVNGKLDRSGNATVTADRRGYSSRAAGLSFARARDAAAAVNGRSDKI